MNKASSTLSTNNMIDNLIYFVEEECYDYDVLLDDIGLREFLIMLIEKLLEKDGVIINIYLIKQYLKYCIEENRDEQMINYNNLINCLDYFEKINVFNSYDIANIKNEINHDDGNYQKIYQDLIKN